MPGSSMALGAGTRPAHALGARGHHEASRYHVQDDHRAAQLSTGAARCGRGCACPADVPAARSCAGWCVTATFALESNMDTAHSCAGPIELGCATKPEFDRSRLPFTTPGLAQWLPKLGARRSAGRGATPPRAPPGRRAADRLGMAPRCTTTTARRVRARHGQRDGTAVVSSATVTWPGTYSDDAARRRCTRLPIGRVTFRLGDSTLPSAPMHSGSKTLASVGSAVFTAAPACGQRPCAPPWSTRVTAARGRPDQVSCADGLLSVAGRPRARRPTGRSWTARRDSMTSQAAGHPATWTSASQHAPARVRRGLGGRAARAGPSTADLRRVRHRRWSTRNSRTARH